jgi:uncharacterized protein (DUF427 family)
MPAAWHIAGFLLTLGTNALAWRIDKKASVDGRVIAESDDIIEAGGYHYFPRSAVRMEWLQKVDKTDSDRACPHGVQFYDVVIDRARHERAAWSYEAPLASMKHVAHRMGFWEDVKVG